MKNKNADKIILDLCGGTGAWSAPYVEAGYTVHVITSPKYDVRLTQIGDNVLTFRGGGLAKLEIPMEKVYGILAAPPCTMFSMARTTAKTPRNFYEGMETVEACLQVIWAVRKKYKLGFWALENPMGYLRQFLGKPQLTFDPCDYGDRYTKRTDLWGYYVQPTKKVYKLTDEEKQRMAVSNRKFHGPPTNAKGVTDWSKWGNNFGHRHQAMMRAITPAGFATAFYKANK